MRASTKLLSAATTAAVIVATGACDHSPSPSSLSERTRLIASDAATGARIAEHRARFVSKMNATSAIGAALATGFERRGGTFRAVLPSATAGAASEGATTDLPSLASGAVRLTDEASGASVAFALRDANDVPLTLADGYALYREAFSGADLLHRVRAEGTEDFVVFERPPARRELAYDVDVSRVAGMRLVSNTLEFVDERGTPRLRVAPPYVIDAKGVLHEATLAVHACAVDESPAAPWGRAVTRAGASSCTVRIDWEADLSYPLLVDPLWTATVGVMTTQRRFHTATLLVSSGLVLVAGGSASAGPDLASAELFDPATKTFAATGSMTSGRYVHSASLLATGKVLVVGGYASPGGGVSGAELYDVVTGKFTVTGGMSTVRYAHTATVLQSGKVLVAGGNANSILATAELYDPVAGTFATTGTMAVTRSDHTASLLASGLVLVAGGFVQPPMAGNVATPTSTAELYDPATQSFSTTGAMATVREAHTATVLVSGKVLVAAGSNGGAYLASAELFDPAAGAFTPTGSLATGRAGQSDALLVSGKVLVAGGFSGAYLASAELFDPVAGTFSTTTAMAVGRQNATATRLGSGKVLVAGGQTTGGGELASAEVLDLIAVGGSVCATGDDCVSGVCEDGICCAGACSGICRTCVAGTGACVMVTAADDSDTCTGTNTCDAAGACKAKKAQPCPGGASTCASGFCSDGYCCDAACTNGCDYCNVPGKIGTCTVASLGDPGANPSCGSSFVCDGMGPACATTCTADTGCSAAFYCASNGTCQARKAQGEVCSVTADCKVADCRVCTTGSCADGVCCDRACDGTCEACTTALKESGADGTCGAARDGSSPLHGMCPADPVATCGRDGKCSGSGGCRAYYPGTTPCGPGASCTNGIATTVTACDGNGACTAGGTTKCNAYVCGAEACKTSCASDADCAMGSTCDVASARCVSTATCDHDHTTISTTGEPHDCSPYKCNPSGACEAACKSVEDCVAPTQCDPTGHCVTPAADDTASGCNASPKRTTGGGLWLAAVGLGLFVVRRRRSGKAW